jgi:uncharacterized glyoxalase superfamily protein PhnB
MKSTVALRSRADVELCRDCLEWLLGRIGVSSTPTLPVRDMREAIDFYQAAGFGVRAYVDGTDTDPGFAFVDYDGQSVFDLDGVPDLDPTANHAGCYLVVDNADAWHARIARAGLPATDLADQPWGMREFAFDDPSGNHVRIGHSCTAAE